MGISPPSNLSIGLCWAAQCLRRWPAARHQRLWACLALAARWPMTPMQITVPAPRPQTGSAFQVPFFDPGIRLLLWGHPAMSCLSSGQALQSMKYSRPPFFRPSPLRWQSLSALLARLLSGTLLELFHAHTEVLHFRLVVKKMSWTYRLQRCLFSTRTKFKKIIGSGRPVRVSTRRGVRHIQVVKKLILRSCSAPSE